MPRQFKNQWVSEKYSSYPDKIRKSLLLIRDLIFQTAAETEGVGELEEDLKWGEPSFLTLESNSGSMIRINFTRDEKYAVLFLCQTNLVKRFRKKFPGQFEFDGNRALLWDKDAAIPKKALKECFKIALTYRLNKKR
jgi:hypothetical protein